MLCWSSARHPQCSPRGEGAEARAGASSTTVGPGGRLPVLPPGYTPQAPQLGTPHLGSYLGNPVSLLPG